MKVGTREIARWLQRVEAAPAVLVHGADLGGVGETAAQIAAAITPDLKDPFRVAMLEPEALKGDPARLADELLALAPGGGRRLVRLRDVGDRQTATIAAALDALPSPPADAGFLLVEAGELAYRSSLRGLFEGHKTAAAILCAEPGEAAAGEFARAYLTAQGFRVGPEAAEALSLRLGTDRALMRRALEVLALYKQADGPGAEITRADVLASVEDAAEAGFEAVIDAVMAGGALGIDRATTKAFAAGVAPVGLLRGVMRALQRVHLVVGIMNRGIGAEAAIGRLAPPVPAPARPAFLAACRAWRPDALDDALALLDEAEVGCKTTGLPETVVCLDALLRLSRLRGEASSVKRA